MSDQTIDRKQVRHILIVSDVHGCASNLKNVLDTVEIKPDLRICLGDVVGGGHDPKRSMQLIQDFDIHIKGEYDYSCGEDHDIGIPIRFLGPVHKDRAALTKAERKELRSYRHSYQWDIMLFFHNSHVRFFEGDLSESEAVKAEMENWPAISMFVCGHLRWARLALYNTDTGEYTFEEDIPEDRDTSYELDFDRYRYLLNVPSIAFGVGLFRFPGYCFLTRLESNRWRLDFRFLSAEGCESLSWREVR